MRRLAVLTVLLALAVAAPARATSAPQVVDPPGDANGVNTLGSGIGPQGVATPVALDAFDILSVRWATAYSGRGARRRATAVVVTMTMKGNLAAPGSAAAGGAAAYRADGALFTECSTVVEYVTSADSATAVADLALCDPQAKGQYVRHPVTAAVRGNTIVWTVPMALLLTRGRIGAAITLLGAEARFNAGAHGTNEEWPVVDVAPQGDGSYTIGH